MTSGNEKIEAPLISVIVPAFNAGSWIRPCCESVFSQSYPNWELIVVDDGSEDDTLAIACETVAGRRNVTVIHTENGGVCHARNVGMDAARGEYITFLDADDGLTQNALQYLYRRIRENDADISVGMLTDRKNMEKTSQCASVQCACWRGTEALLQSLKDHPACYTVYGKLYKKAFLSQLRFVEGREFHEDSFFIFQCFLKQPKVAVGPDWVVGVRTHYGSVTRSAFSEHIFDIDYFTKEKQRLIEAQYPELLPYTDILLLKANMALLRGLCKTYHPQYREKEKQCIRMIQEKRSCFYPATKADEKWFWIITHHVFPIYKLVFFIRWRLRKLTHA